jgi:diguanylate cyclase (GGDEF)-like protein/PAS domain S-box-containing protein
MKPVLGSLLIVDDNEANRNLLCQYLERKGYVTTAAEGGRQALELVEKQPFDVMLLDIRMPELDGFAVLKLLRQSYTSADLPVIMVTANDESTDIVTALDLGANDYITKPVDFPVAMARIRTQVSRKRAEAARRDSDERYALAVRGSNDGLWDWNLHTKDVYFSPRWKAILGCAEDEIDNSLEGWFSHVHPEDRQRLEAAIMAHLDGQTPHFEQEHRLLHKDGNYRWVLSRGMAVRDATGKSSRIAGSLTDITERKVADVLTGLPNRVLFLDRLGRALEHAKWSQDFLFAVLLLDLDRFKMINESLGHVIGDQMLSAMAHRLEDCLRNAAPRPGEGYTIARLGGDEFAILLEGIQDINDATCVAERLQQQLAAPFTLGGHEVFTTASIGIALSATGYGRPEDLLRDADTAMYRAKAHGKACHEVFDTAMHARAVARLQVETDLRRAVERQEFRVVYQPIVALASGRLVGFEALVRWQHPHRGLVPPLEFIPVAEENGLIIPIGQWVLRTACQQIRAWQQQCSAHLPLSIGVNLSGKEFMQPNLAAQIAQVLEETALEPRSLQLEITESVLMDHTAAGTLAQLRALGLELSMDDFGTGYSSLSYLHRFPMQILKIDRSFVNRMGAEGPNANIVRTIISLARDLGMQVIAEGVETAEHLDALRALNCGYGQGYFFSKPLDAEAATALLMAAPQW